MSRTDFHCGRFCSNTININKNLQKKKFVTKFFVEQGNTIKYGSILGNLLQCDFKSTLRAHDEAQLTTNEALLGAISPFGSSMLFLNTGLSNRLKAFHKFSSRT